MSESDGAISTSYRLNAYKLLIANNRYAYTSLCVTLEKGAHIGDMSTNCIHRYSNKIPHW